MRELSLFSGAGGGLLGTKLLEWKHCGYVEYDDYCQRIIAQRIEDGILDEAPIFCDIRAFIGEGYADAYSGMVDVVTAGFPCQPFSIAGKKTGSDDDRNMWPQTIDVICRVRPEFVLLENVPGLLAHEYSQQIFRDLAESGFECRWRVLSAAELGAPHKRDRLWIAADNKSNRCRQRRAGRSVRNGAGIRKQTVQIADTIGNELREQSRRRNGTRRSNTTELKYPGWWELKSDVGRVAYGVANRVDRLKALGNGQVPIVVKTAWELLNRK